MKGIETYLSNRQAHYYNTRSDHCPAMKGIETRRLIGGRFQFSAEATTAPQ